jgi:hypothetical protein
MAYWQFLILLALASVPAWAICLLPIIAPH